MRFAVLWSLLLLALAPPVFAALEGDRNGDGRVDAIDLAIVTSAFGSTSCGGASDVNNDCKVDVFDIVRVTRLWGQVEVVDAIPPTQVSSLLASGTTATSTTLIWSAATDAVGVTSYRVESCAGAGCGNYAEIASVAGTSYTHTGLSPASTYLYRIRARDAAGNNGPYSATGTVTTLSGSDTIPPVVTITAPSANQILASGTTQTTFSVTTNEAATCRYSTAANQVFTSMTIFSTTGGTSHTATVSGLTGGQTYTRYVQCRDLPGNAAAEQSHTFSVATGQACGNGIVEAGEQCDTGASRGNCPQTCSLTCTQNPCLPPGNTITLNSATRYQTIVGWEGTGQIGATIECNNAAPSAAIIDRAVNELGLNRVRLEVKSGAENPVDYAQQYENGQIDMSQFRPRRYESINDNTNANTINAAGFHFWALDHDIDTIVVPMRQALAARGESLYVNLNYVDFSTTNNLHRTNPAEYAEFMLAVFQHMDSKYGFVPNAVEIVLEPENTAWTGTNIGQATKAAGDRLAAAGYYPDFILPSVTNANNALTYTNAAVAVPGAQAYVKEISYHLYGGISQSLRQSILNRAKQLGARTSQLEFIGATPEQLMDDLRDADVSAWQQFTIAFCSAGGGGNYYSFSPAGQPNLQLEPQSRYFPQIMQFVRAGAVRYGASSSSAQLGTVAFENANGKHVVVAQATAAQTITVIGLPAGTYGISYTTASAFMTALPDQTISSGQTISFAMPAAGYATVYGKPILGACVVNTWSPSLSGRCGSVAQTSNCGTTRSMQGSVTCTAQQTCTNNVCVASGDSTPPTATINLPGAGEQLVVGTTQTPLSVVTNEAATCLWSTTDQAYGAMTQTMTTSNGIAHTASLTGLQNGQPYVRYVRCADSIGNAMTTSVSRSFSVASSGGASGGSGSIFAPNLPSGMRLVADTSFENYVDGTNGADGVEVINWAQNTVESASTFGVRGVPSTGSYGARALRIWFPGRHAGDGIGPATLMVGGLNSRAHYMVVRMRYSPNYVLHTNGEKMFYPVGPPLATGGNGAAYAASMNVGGSGHLLGYDAPIETGPPMGPLSAANVIPVGRWFTVEFFAEMNTPGQSDGTLQAWVDGVRVVDKRGVMLSNTATQQLFDRGRRDFTRGGGPSDILTPPEGQWVEVDRLAFYAR